MRASTGLRRRVSAVILAAILAGLGGVILTSPLPASAASKCAPLTKKVHLVVDAKRGTSVLTYNTRFVASLKKSGLSDLGVVFKASSKLRSGQKAVRAMYNTRTRDRIYTTSASEIKGLKKKGYKDNGVAFYAYSKSASCLYPVYRFHKGSLHRFVGTASDRAALKKQGWIEQNRVFWLSKPASLIKTPAASKPPATKPPTTKPPTGDTTFSIAVLPDTQQEVLKAGDPRFAGRTQWLVDQRKSLDLRFVTHTGDVVNWDTPDHNQYKVAKNAMDKLGAAGIPYSLSPGNHDTAAVCPGGAGCPGKPVTVTVRDTTTFNTYLSGGTTDRAGQFEAGKVDNVFYEFQAGGLKWMVLNLELWPRTEVVSWAQKVVAAHPHDNVMVVTHSYLNSNATIGAGKSYGATSPKYLYDNLITRYANIRLVFSGHVGSSAHRADKGVHGNRIDSFLLCMHSNTTNPMRLVEFNTATGSLRTWVYSPYTKTNYPGYTTTLSKLSFVR